MASIRARKETGLLFIDFRFQDGRCREQTLLPDTPANHERLQKLVDRMEKAMLNGSFRYADYFPNSPRATQSSSTTAVATTQVPSASAASDERTSPVFREFAALWFEESAPRWRKRNEAAMRATLDSIILPSLGDKKLHEIGRADLLAFRAEISKRSGHGGGALSNKRINKIMSILASVLNEGCDRSGLTSPSRTIKPLKQKRTEVFPFTLDEVNLIVEKVRKDYRNYLTLRMLTGLRTGEADGLQWEDMDFDRGLIRIERTHSRDGDGETKTEGSRRFVPMVPAVREALTDQLSTKAKNCLWVFHSKHGLPVDSVNFTNRVWYPLLRHLGLRKRPPYQMRHTAATLMLASGENPEWVAQTLGHSTTEMLFRVYSRYVPNLTRNDGGAYAGMLNQKLDRNAASAEAPRVDIASLSAEQKAQLIAQLTQSLTATKGVMT